MISFPLKLKALPAASHGPAAWFIPGDDPSRWLGEIARWQVPMHDLRLYVLPTSLSDRTPSGVLVELPKGAAPAAVLHALPYGRIAGRLFLPVDAALDPPVSDSELNAALSLAIHVMHPAAGLVGFAEDDVLRAADLIAPPSQRAIAWDRADAGEATMGRLLAVAPEEVPALQDFLEQGRDDIGSKSPDELPGAPDESKIARAGRLIGLAPLMLVNIAIVGPLKVLQFLGRLLPKSAASSRADRKSGASPPAKRAKPGWIEAFQNWLAKKFPGVSKSLHDARMRELERLRNMLQSNPDEGLRYAISLRDIPSRGRAQPGSQLVRRDTNFLLSSLGGGDKPADPWSIPPDMVRNLTAQYREAANRELALGRFRRAAYIFSELLGDFTAACNALQQGRFYREAAIVYRDHLGRPMLAADCLARGGLLAEAAAIYEKLGMWENAGDLHARLDFPEEAARCFHEQVNIYRGNSDFLNASRLFEQKLNASDQAIEVLSNAWPGTDGAEACLRELFKLLSRLNRHDEAASRIQHFRAAQTSHAIGAALATVLSTVATTYPEATVRLTSADAARVVVGLHLSDSDGPDRTRLARALAPLAPEDRLLNRDVERFLSRPLRKPPLKQFTRSGRDPVVVRKFHLPGDVIWKKVAVDESGFFVLGVAVNKVRILRGSWDGCWQMVDGKSSLAHLDINWKLEPMPESSAVAVIPSPSDGLPLSLVRTALFPTSTDVICPNWIDQRTLTAIARGSAGTIWALSCDALRVHRAKSGELIATHALEVDVPPPTGQIELVAHHNQVFATWGSAVLTFHNVGGWHVEAMPLATRHLAIARRAGLSSIAVALTEGVRLLSGDSFDEPFAEGLADPLIAFTRGGMLVAANANEGRVYEIQGAVCRRRGTFAGIGAGPLALTATKNLNEFATFNDDGTVIVYQAMA